MSSHVTDTIMMIRPFGFAYNIETAKDNVYQNLDASFSSKDVSEKAKLEFDLFVNVLKKAHINVIEFNDSNNEYTPDSVFPNNWISTHLDGTIHLYPMYAANRRLERRADILRYLKKNFIVNNINKNFLQYELQNKFLEGTGSLVLDRENRIAYACISNRTNQSLLIEWCTNMQFKPCFFTAKDSGQHVYHTNVVMSVCQDMVFVCLDCITNILERNELVKMINSTHKQIINISFSQMNSFLGNVLELKNKYGDSFLVMSTTAFNTLSDSQKKIINKKNSILHSPLHTIEYFGGGSARCMIAEIFLNPLTE